MWVLVRIVVDVESKSRGRLGIALLLTIYTEDPAVEQIEKKDGAVAEINDGEEAA